MFFSLAYSSGNVLAVFMEGYRVWRYLGGLLLFAMIRSVLKLFKVPDVGVVAARMSNESALTCMTTQHKKNLCQT